MSFSLPESLAQPIARHPLLSRVFTGVVGIPLIAAAIWFGLPWLTAFVAATAVMAALELSSMARGAGRNPSPTVAAAWSLSLVAIAHVMASDYEGQTSRTAFVTVAVFAYAVWQIRYVRRGMSGLDWAATAGAAFYSGGLLAHVLLLRSLDDGRCWVLCVVLATFAADTFAFAVGRLIGRTPLAPRVSPGKTWEGAAAGLLAATAVAPISVALAGIDVPLATVVVLGAVLGGVGQLGDLAESRLKRMAGMGASGWVLPGHGGVMDRLDSIVPNVAVMYYFVRLVIY